VKTYYNEWEPYSAAWLRNLIEAGLLPDGDVDERDIREIKGSDLDGYGQCHFFAGIGGWPLALALAGWPADAPVWSGSCPCQPFSTAGKRMGSKDERHLFPDFCRLIAERKPSTVFGEQVASIDGRDWLSRVRVDLEALGYGVGAADLCVAGLGAPHIRQRLWWVADAGHANRRGGEHPEKTGGKDGGLADGGHPERRTGDRSCNPEGRDLLRQERKEVSNQPRECGEADGVGHTEREGPQGRDIARGRSGKFCPWTPSIAIPCIDGKARRIEPGIMPLAHGVPGRVGQIRAYGNAIVPQVAAEFVKAYMDISSGGVSGVRGPS
jgi:DNA (cytosine-5)-methyltransferase 1